MNMFGLMVSYSSSPDNWLSSMVELKLYTEYITPIDSGELAINLLFLMTSYMVWSTYATAPLSALLFSKVESFITNVPYNE